MRHLFLIAISFIGLFIGCAPALPVADQDPIATESFASATASASKAQAAAAEAREHAAHGERLLEEARAILKKAEEIEKSCAATARIISKKRTASVTKPAPTDAGKPKTETNPEWSPSDRPS